MKRVLRTAALLVFITLTSFTTATKTEHTTVPANQGLSLLEIGNGLKEALVQSTSKSSDQLSAVDGFFANAAVKILFPPEAQKAEKTLRKLGLNKLCDDVILSLNRAAEDAAKQAKPIFIDAIKHMTLEDVKGILLGGQDAATQYFKRAATSQLSLAFKPVINGSLGKAGATKYYGTAAAEYNKLPFVKKINPDISAFVTQKAIEGLFYQIAQEELKIRKDISFRTTPLMQKIFAFADKKQ